MNPYLFILRSSKVTCSMLTLSGPIKDMDSIWKRTIINLEHQVVLWPERDSLSEPYLNRVFRVFELWSGQTVTHRVDEDVHSSSGRLQKKKRWGFLVLAAMSFFNHLQNPYIGAVGRREVKLIERSELHGQFSHHNCARISVDRHNSLAVGHWVLEMGVLKRWFAQLTGIHWSLITRRPPKI